MLQKVTFVKELEHIMLLAKDSQTKQVAEDLENKKELLKRNLEYKLAHATKRLEDANPENTLRRYFDGILNADYAINTLAQSEKVADQAAEYLDQLQVLYTGIFATDYVFDEAHLLQEHLYIPGAKESYKDRC